MVKRIMRAKNECVQTISDLNNKRKTTDIQTQTNDLSQTQGNTPLLTVSPFLTVTKTLPLMSTHSALSGFTASSRFCTLPPRSLNPKNGPMPFDRLFLDEISISTYGGCGDAFGWWRANELVIGYAEGKDLARTWKRMVGGPEVLFLEGVSGVGVRLSVQC